MNLVELAREVVARFEDWSNKVVDLRGEAPVVGHWDRSRIDQVVLPHARAQPASLRSAARGEAAFEHTAQHSATAPELFAQARPDAFHLITRGAH